MRRSAWSVAQQQDRSDMAPQTERSENTVSNRTMELVVAGSFIALAILVMYDNWRIGARWAEDGPQAGYFPFYIGLIMFIASAVTAGITHFAGPVHPTVAITLEPFDVPTTLPIKPIPDANLPLMYSSKR